MRGFLLLFHDRGSLLSCGVLRVGSRPCNPLCAGRWDNNRAAGMCYRLYVSSMGDGKVLCAVRSRCYYECSSLSCTDIASCGKAETFCCFRIEEVKIPDLLLSLHRRIPFTSCPGDTIGSERKSLQRSPPVRCHISPGLLF